MSGSGTPRVRRLLGAGLVVVVRRSATRRRVLLAGASAPLATLGVLWVTSGR